MDQPEELDKVDVCCILLDYSAHHLFIYIEREPSENRFANFDVALLSISLLSTFILLNLKVQENPI